MNDIKYVSMRQDIESVVGSPYEMYYDKLLKINKLLRNLVEDKIEFIEYTDELIDQIDDLSSCIKSNEERCKDKPYCASTDELNCKFMVPSRNLITGKNNEAIYFTRMADEIIRFGRIRLFLFRPQAYLSFKKLGYDLGVNEIILLETLLNQDYFENLVPETKISYNLVDSYDTVQPAGEVPYSKYKTIDNLHKTKIPKFNLKKKTLTLKPAPPKFDDPNIEAVPIVSLDETEAAETVAPEVTAEEIDAEENDADESVVPETVVSAIPVEVQKKLCSQTRRDVIKGSLQKNFTKGVKEYIFENSSSCSFQIYLFMVRLFHKDKLGLTSYEADVAELKRILWKQYQNFLDKYENQMLIMLSDQGKKQMVERVNRGEINLEELIMSEEYYLTNLDFMLLNLYYRLPIVLISLKVFGENKKKILLLEKNSAGRYFYMKQGAVKRNHPRMVSLLVVDETYTLEKTALSDDFLQKLEMEEREVDNEKYSDRLTDIISGYKSINFKRKKILIVKPKLDETKVEETRSE